MKKIQKNDNAVMELVQLANTYMLLKNGGCPSALLTKMESLLETAVTRVK